MAIKVNGTTVIDDNRNLVNIASGAGSSTTAGAVGTYLFARHSIVTGELTLGETTSGGNLEPANANGGVTGASPSGTWRTMGYALTGSSSGTVRTTLFVRIS